MRPEAGRGETAGVETVLMARGGRDESFSFLFYLKFLTSAEELTKERD
jgi:hypothetical protein